MLGLKPKPVAEDHSGFVVEIGRAEQFMVVIEQAYWLSQATRLQIIAGIHKWLDMAPFDYLVVLECPSGMLTMNTCSSSRLGKILREQSAHLNDARCWWTLIVDDRAREVFDNVVGDKHNGLAELSTFMQDADYPELVGSLH